MAYVILMRKLDNLAVVYDSQQLLIYFALTAFDINLPNTLIHCLIFPITSFQPFFS